MNFHFSWFVDFLLKSLQLLVSQNQMYKQFNCNKPTRNKEETMLEFSFEGWNVFDFCGLIGKIGIGNYEHKI
jgi:hypothetical protein